MNFVAALRDRWAEVNSLVCVGLDPEPSRFPAHLAEDPDAVFAFCRDIVDATAELACAFKPQIAHFAALGAEAALARLIAHIHGTHPAIPVILDAKRGDIGNTAQHYASEAFDRYRADAVTVNPYLGRDAVQPFLDRVDKGVIILCRTSNAGAAEFQDLRIAGDAACPTMPLHRFIAGKVSREWNQEGNCALVVGASAPAQLAEVRAIAGNMPLLVPGVGAQGGDVEAIVRSGLDRARAGLLISASRSILYASDEGHFAEAARDATRALRDTINRFR